MGGMNNCFGLIMKDEVLTARILNIALKCTRFRQRFMCVVGRCSMTERDSCQEGDDILVQLITLSIE